MGNEHIDLHNPERVEHKKAPPFKEKRGFLI